MGRGKDTLVIFRKSGEGKSTLTQRRVCEGK